jgi:hypothetical protein
VDTPSVTFYLSDARLSIARDAMIRETLDMLSSTIEWR